MFSRLKLIIKYRTICFALSSCVCIFYKIPSKGIPKTVVTSERLVWMSEVTQFASETERY